MLAFARAEHGERVSLNTAGQDVASGGVSVVTQYEECKKSLTTPPGGT